MILLSRLVRKNFSSHIYPLAKEEATLFKSYRQQEEQAAFIRALSRIAPQLGSPSAETVLARAEELLKEGAVKQSAFCRVVFECIVNGMARPVSADCARESWGSLGPFERMLLLEGALTEAEHAQLQEEFSQAEYISGKYLLRLIDHLFHRKGAVSTALLERLVANANVLLIQLLEHQWRLLVVLKKNKMLQKHRHFTNRLVTSFFRNRKRTNCNLQELGYVLDIAQIYKENCSKIYARPSEVTQFVERSFKQASLDEEPSQVNSVIAVCVKALQLGYIRFVPFSRYIETQRTNIRLSPEIFQFLRCLDSFFQRIDVIELEQSALLQYEQLKENFLQIESLLEFILSKIVEQGDDKEIAMLLQLPNLLSRFHAELNWQLFIKKAKGNQLAFLRLASVIPDLVPFLQQEQFLKLIREQLPSVVKTKERNELLLAYALISKEKDASFVEQALLANKIAHTPQPDLQRFNINPTDGKDLLLPMLCWSKPQIVKKVYAQHKSDILRKIKSTSPYLLKLSIQTATKASLCEPKLLSYFLSQSSLLLLRFSLVNFRFQVVKSEQESIEKVVKLLAAFLLGRLQAGQSLIEVLSEGELRLCLQDLALLQNMIMQVESSLTPQEKGVILALLKVFDIGIYPGISRALQLSKKVSNLNKLNFKNIDYSKDPNFSILLKKALFKNIPVPGGDLQLLVELILARIDSVSFEEAFLGCLVHFAVQHRKKKSVPEILASAQRFGKRLNYIGKENYTFYLTKSLQLKRIRVPVELAPQQGAQSFNPLILEKYVADISEEQQLDELLLRLKLLLQEQTLPNFFEFAKELGKFVKYEVHPELNEILDQLAVQDYSVVAGLLIIFSKGSETAVTFRESLANDVLAFLLGVCKVSHHKLLTRNKDELAKALKAII